MNIQSDQMRTLLLLLLVCSLGACTARPSDDDADELTLLVGTYTDGNSRGIYTFRFDGDSGECRPLDSIALPNPSFLTVSGDLKHVYAVSEMNDSTAMLNLLAFNPSDGRLRLLNRLPTHGTDPCHVATNGRLVLTANYSGGSLSVFPLQADGTTASADTLFYGTANGPDSLRQIVPHVHCTAFSPDGKFVFATDFSADRLLRFDVTAHGLTPSPDSTFVSVRPDSGPRHLTFSPDGRHAYLIGELSGLVTAFAYEAGRLTPIQTIAADTTGARGSADIHVSPDGRFLYASNRLKNDGIAIFSIQPQTGKLTPAGYQPTGRHPRNFGITPDGKYLLAACRDDNVIQVYRRDMQTGLLDNTHQDIHVDKPVCIVFVNKP